MVGTVGTGIVVGTLGVMGTVGTWVGVLTFGVIWDVVRFWVIETGDWVRCFFWLDTVIGLEAVEAGFEAETGFEAEVETGTGTL